MNDLFLAGELAAHRRGRILEEAVSAGRLDGDRAPAAGMALLFGTEFQAAPEARQAEWADWCSAPGRCLLLVPPFRAGQVMRPREWRVHPIPGGQAKPGEHPLQRLLAAEARFYLSGALQPPEHLGGVWGDGTVNTGLLRRHPLAGVFAVTCLPVWSVAVLEHRPALRGWLAGLLELAGSPAAPAPSEPPFTPSEEHVAVLLHLGSRSYPDAGAAREGLARSPYFRVPPDGLERLLRDLQRSGMLDGLRLTDGGRAWLAAGPYAAYLDALQEAQS